MQRRYELIHVETPPAPNLYAGFIEEFSRDIYGNYFILGCVAYTMGNIGAHVMNAMVVF